jgi:hypothetical protein
MFSLKRLFVVPEVASRFSGPPQRRFILFLIFGNNSSSGLSVQASTSPPFPIIPVGPAAEVLYLFEVNAYVID